MGNLSGRETVAMTLVLIIIATGLIWIMLAAMDVIR
jgi:hypothetical protein